MAMYYLILVFYAGNSITSITIPEKYTEQECKDIVKYRNGRDFCIPAPKGDYCKWNYHTEIINAGDSSIPVTTKQCEN